MVGAARGIVGNHPSTVHRFSGAQIGRVGAKCFFDRDHSETTQSLLRILQRPVSGHQRRISPFGTVQNWSRKTKMEDFVGFWIRASERLLAGVCRGVQYRARDQFCTPSVCLRTTTLPYGTNGIQLISYSCRRFFDCSNRIWAEHAGQWL